MIFEKPTIAKKGYFDTNNEDSFSFDEDDLDEKNEDKTDVYSPSNNDELTPFKQRLHYILVVVLVITFWASFYGFYWTSDLAETVTDGVSILRAKAWYWYCCLFVFVAVLMFINHVEIIRSAKSFCSGIYFVFTGCKVHDDIETRFETPKWIKNGNMNNNKNEEEKL